MVFSRDNKKDDFKVRSKPENPPIEELKAIAHPLRLLILNVLLRGELNVGEIEKISGIGQPTLSQQLSILRRAGLVKTHKNAKLVFYSRDKTRLAAVAEAISAGDAHTTPEKLLNQTRSPGTANFARLPGKR